MFGTTVDVVFAFLLIVLVFIIAALFADQERSSDVYNRIANRVNNWLNQRTLFWSHISLFKKSN